MNTNRQAGAVASSLRTTALVTGVLFIITYVTSIPPRLMLYLPILTDANYIVGAGADAQIALGAFLELLLIIANIGTAVVLFPVLKRQSEKLALSYVGARIIESTFIAVGLLSLLAVGMLRQEFAGATGSEAGSLVVVGRSLYAVYELAFGLGPGFTVGVGNGLILGYLMYRSGLVPPRLALFGLVGGPLIIASGTAVLFDVIQPGSMPQIIATLPEFIWELALGIYLTVKGFRPSAITSELARADAGGLMKAA
jgi:hypothetical protein